MSSSKYDTEEWTLGAWLEWRPKERAVECSHCGGTGTVGGHFKDLDGPQPCPECHGSRFQLAKPTTPVPEIPADLREHMRRAWFDFHHKEQS